MDEKSVLPGLIGGRYLLESKIAHGGMAVVWLAKDTFLDRWGGFISVCRT